MKLFNDLVPLIECLREDAKVYDRHPVRFILVKGLSAFQEIVEGLKLEVEEIIELSSLCIGADSFPYLPDIIPLIKEKKGKLLILPLAECLRFGSDYKTFLGELAVWEDPGYKRIYIPLLEADDMFESQMSMITRSSAEGTLPEAYAYRGTGKVEVRIIPFKLKRVSVNTVTGVKEYLQIWEYGGKNGLYFVTQNAPHLNGRVGNFEVRVYLNGYELMKGKISDFSLIRPEWGNEGQWLWLAEELSDEEDFDLLAAKCLNISQYDADQLLARWDTLDAYQRWLFWIWSKLRASEGTYLQLVLKDNHNISEFVDVVANQPFKGNLDNNLLKERKKMLVDFGVQEMPQSFWRFFNELEDPLERLKSLACISDREKVEAVLAIKQLLEQNLQKETWWPYLEIAYPELSFYLTPYPHDDSFIEKYFMHYAMSRILDNPHEELLAMAVEAAEKKKIWSYSTRESVLETYPSKTSRVWVDGMGLEWLGLLKGLFGCRDDIKMTVAVTRTNLPTTTEFNKGWNKEEEVDRRLDGLAHHYNYRFPSTFVEEIGVINDTVKKIIQILKEENEVIITSDHGLTRFAFTGGKTPPPKDAQVHKWGRYADLKQQSNGKITYSPSWITEGDRVMLAVHEKFEGGAWSGGEVHGGATPEEWLVPVIRLERVRKVDLEERIRFRILTPVVRLNVRGEGRLEIEIDAPVEKVWLEVVGRIFPGSLEGVQDWAITLKDLKPGSYRGKLACERGLLGEIKFELVKGLVEDDLGL